MAARAGHGESQRGASHGVDLLVHFAEHDAVVLKLGDLRKFLGDLLGAGPIDIAERDDLYLGVRGDTA